MSKHRYIEVQALYQISFSENIQLPENWDAMQDDEREAHVKKAAGEGMMIDAHEHAYEIAKSIARSNGKCLCQWEVVSETRKCAVPLLEVITKPLIQLVLDGTYEHKDWIDDDEELDEEEND